MYKPSVKQLRRYSPRPRTYSHAPAVPVSNKLRANENLMTDPAAARRTQYAIYRVKSNILPGSASIFRGRDDNMLRIKPVPLLLAPLLLLQVNENPISRVYLHGPVSRRMGEERIWQSVFHQRYGWKVSDRYLCRHRDHRIELRSINSHLCVIYASHVMRAHILPLRFWNMLIKCHTRWETRCCCCESSCWKKLHRRVHRNRVQ